MSASGKGNYASSEQLRRPDFMLALALFVLPVVLIIIPSYHMFSLLPFLEFALFV